MQEKQQQILEKYFNAVQQFDTQTMMSDMHDNVFFQSTSNGVVTLEAKGIADFAEQAEMTKTYFETREMLPMDWHFDGNTVTVDANYKAILAIAMSETLQPGDLFQVKGQIIAEFDGDKIIKLTYAM